MSKTRETLHTIHISGIDEFLASRLVEGELGPLSFTVSNADSEGNITLAELDTTEEDTASEGIDFELSTCECRGLDASDIEDYLERPVYTSSAYEFFDFILGYLSSFDCVVGFTGNAWRIRVFNPVRVG